MIVAVLRVAQPATARELLDVAASEGLGPEGAEAFTGQEHSDVHRDPPVPVLVERHGAHDRVWNASLVEEAGELQERPLDVGFAREEPRGIRDSRPEAGFGVRIELGSPRSHVHKYTLDSGPPG